MRRATEIAIDASADHVWEIVGRQFDRVGDWATAMPASRPGTHAACDTAAPVAIAGGGGVV